MGKIGQAKRWSALLFFNGTKKLPNRATGNWGAKD
jgi:hypothetical protein